MWLTISSTSESPRTTRLTPGPSTIGRSQDCDIVVSDPHVSQHHARVDVLQDGTWVTDLGSTNGTYVDGATVSGRTRLEPLSRVQIGTLMLTLSASPPTQPVTVERDPQPMTTRPVDDAVPLRPPAPPVPPPRVQDAGLVARDVDVSGDYVAVRDFHLHEGLKLRTKMRRSAKRCLQFGCLLLLVGMGLVGYFVVASNTRLFDAINSGSFDQPDTVSPVPWLPAGFAAGFAGFVLIVVGLLIPRDRVVVSDDSSRRAR